MAAVVSVIGTIFSFIGERKQAKAAARAEEARKRAMELEERRKRREMIRQGIIARAQAEANAANQGALGSSGLAGGLAQITTTTGRGLLASQQDQTLGQKVFDANADYARAGGLVALGGAIKGFSSTFGSTPFLRAFS